MTPQHAPVREVVKVGGVYIPYEEWRRQHPISWQQRESNRLAFLFMLWQREQNKSQEGGK